jgi:glycogen synthase
MAEQKNKANDRTLRILQEKLREILNIRSDHITDAGCKDYADYQYHVGVLHGIGIAERELLDFDDKITVEDD